VKPGKRMWELNGPVGHEVGESGSQAAAERARGIRELSPGLPRGYHVMPAARAVDTVPKSEEKGEAPGQVFDPEQKSEAVGASLFSGPCSLLVSTAGS
jgi:hypothetical protein